MPVLAVQCREADSRVHRLLFSRYMPSRYAQWMYDWEHRLTSVDNNRVVRPLEWGLEYARDWPCRNGWQPGQAADDPAKFLIDFNRRIVADSDEFYSYKPATDFRLEKREVQVFSTRSSRPEAGSEGKRNVRGVPALHSACEDAVSGKQSGECALVSGARTARCRSSAALECGRNCLREPLQSSQHAGRRGAAVEHA